ncbi:NLP/P60 protein [Desulfobulbus propionicus DSM 2032]|uniref:NLP/P60 protein n=1 Tax=Desulfobulbus propionicus (strain ATCC 33891 / DSM 2032 / VKM B-1956 / 1pr3) TaxID=577650 RepID=A0A7U4DP21_DESPD|nr:NlpC/P60 family N-terminal domain-containing protein [Desulfobulbus propionicus]ADW17602.1 NLP/P60 protein [Desulfobulbus propionicus DSM 2032]
MNRLLSTWLIAAVTLALFIWAVSLLHWDRPSPRQRASSPEKATCPQTLATSTTINDLQTIPQDIGPFAAVFKQTMRADEQRQAARQFHQQYFTPWTTTAPLFETTTVAEGVRQLAAQTWYGENRLIVEPTRMQHLLALADLERFPSMNQLGIAIKPSFIRILPTMRPFYETPDDVPFDHLQFAEIKPNEPVRLLHATTDGAWLYIETSYANGWVDPEAIRLVDESVRNRLANAPQLVVVRDYSSIQTTQSKILPQPKIGTLYPLVKEEADHWLVDVAVVGDDQHATLATARIAKNDARRHPLPLNSENVTLIGNELLKTDYGWGELYRNRDCSATTRDFFLAFGIWLPRNSYKQITSGPFVPLAGLSTSDKELRIREQGIPFRTLLHHKGHIMLYVGLHNSKPVILHTAWGLAYRPTNCPEQKFIIGRTIVSTLEAGKELSLSKGTTLDRLDGMLLLPVPDKEHAQRNQPSAAGVK